MRQTAGMRTLDAWYDLVDADQVLAFVRAEVSEKRLGKEEAKEVERDIAKARTRDHARLLARAN